MTQRLRLSVIGTRMHLTYYGTKQMVFLNSNRQPSRVPVV
jgi:hypothetical protein